MFYQEKRTIVDMIASVLVTAIYIWYVYQTNQGADVGWAHDAKLWARAFLIYIPIMIVVRILIQIVFAILTKITTDEEPAVSDEYDKLVALKAMRNARLTFGVGVVLSMATLVIGWPIGAMFGVLFSFVIVSDIVEVLSQFYFYRRGI